MVKDTLDPEGSERHQASGSERSTPRQPVILIPRIAVKAGITAKLVADRASEFEKIITQYDARGQGIGAATPAQRRRWKAQVADDTDWDTGVPFVLGGPPEGPPPLPPGIIDAQQMTEIMRARGKGAGAAAGTPVTQAAAGAEEEAAGESPLNVPGGPGGAIEPFPIPLRKGLVPHRKRRPARGLRRRA